MNCSEEARKALIGSIKKWEAITAGTGIKKGAQKNCPLCQKFYNLCCMGCPISEKTGYRYCTLTPYEEWESHHNNTHHHYLLYYVVEGCEECKRLAQKEVDFLKNLLVEMEKGGTN